MTKSLLTKIFLPLSLVYLSGCASVSGSKSDYFGYRTPKPAEEKQESSIAKKTVLNSPEYVQPTADTMATAWENPIENDNEPTIINNYYYGGRSYVPVVVPWWDRYYDWNAYSSWYYPTCVYPGHVVIVISPRRRHYWGWGWDSWYSPYYSYNPWYGGHYSHPHPTWYPPRPTPPPPPKKTRDFGTQRGTTQSGTPTPLPSGGIRQRSENPVQVNPSVKTEAKTNVPSGGVRQRGVEKPASGVAPGNAAESEKKPAVQTPAKPVNTNAPTVRTRKDDGEQKPQKSAEPTVKPKSVETTKRGRDDAEPRHSEPKRESVRQRETPKSAPAERKSDGGSKETKSDNSSKSEGVRKR